MKKLLALLLAIVMVLGLVACNPNKPGDTTAPAGDDTQPVDTTEADLYYNKTGLPICDEPITIKVSGLVGGTTNWQDTYMVKWIEENLGIKMICEPLSNDVMKTQYGLWLSDPESMPDLIINGTGVSRSQVDADGEDGFWLDMAEYKELMPNIYAFWEEYPALGDLTQTNEGSVYSLTRITSEDSSKINEQIYYHIPTLEAAGVDGSKIKTVNDLYDALVKLKAAYPDKIPYLITPDVEPAYRNELNLRTAFGVYSNNNSLMVEADDAGNATLLDISDEHREYLKFLNKLQSEGLIDITDVTRTADDIKADVKEGKYCFFTGLLPALTDADKALDEAKDYSWRENYGLIAALTSDKVTESTYIANNGVLNQARVLINAETEYPEAIIRLLDFFHSPEGQIMAIYGVEGEIYDWKVDDAGIKQIDRENYWDKDNYETVADWTIQYIIPQQALAFRWGFIGTVDSLTEAERAKVPTSNTNYWTLRKLDACHGVDNFQYASAPIIMTPEQSEAAGSLPADLTAFLVTAKVEFINGTRDPNSDADWNAFVKQVQDMGWNQLQPIYQEAMG